MATVNKLLLEQAELEADTKAMLIDGADETIKVAVRAGFRIACVAAVQRILDLSVKGVIPDGRGGRIMNEVKTAVEDSRKRVTGA